MTNHLNLRNLFFTVITLLACVSAWATDNVYPLSDTELARRIAAKEQITDVPTIYIDIDAITDEASLASVLYKIRKSNADDEEIAPYSTATITVVDNSAAGSPQHLESFTDQVEIKVRGNSTASAGNGKLPYRLRFAKKGDDGISHKHDLLGYGYTKRNWTLLANNFDRSMLRNAVTYHIGKYVGMDFCPGYKYVDLVISGLYRGTYMVSDHCETGSNRVDVANEDTDWYMEFTCWGQMAEVPYVGQGDGDDHFVSIKNPEPETETEISQLKSEVQEWRKNWIASFNNNSWQKTNDVESFIKFYIANEITGDLDGYFVFKGSKEANGLFKWGPLWDKDLAFGNSTYANDQLSAFYNKTQFEWVFKNSLFKDKSFLTLAKNKIDQLVEEGLYDKLAADIDNIVALTTNTRLQNYAKWDITASSMGSEVYTMANYDEHVTVLKNYISNRISYIQEQLQGYIDELPQPVDRTYDPTLTGWEGESYIPTVGVSYNLNIANRTLTGGQWNAFCVPFNATQAQVEEALGCSYELAVHTGIDTDGETMLFSAPESLDLVSGVPYLIKPQNNVSTFGRFNDVVYSANLQYGQYNGDAVSFDNIHFFKAQIYKKDITIADSYTFISDIYTDESSLAHPVGSDTWSTLASLNGARAYITTSDNSTPKIKFVTTQGGDDPVERTQLSEVPTIFIDTESGAEIQPSTGEFVAAAIEVLDKNQMIGGDFSETSSFMEIRGRGKTEWAADDGKKSYRIRFAKDEKDGDGNVTVSHKHDMTNGGYAKRNWILLANAADASMARNAMADELGKAMGFDFTPCYQFVDLYINNEYQGTYMATDHVEADLEQGESHRVAVDEKQGWLLDMVNADGISTGDVYVEGDGNSYPYINIKNPEPGKKTGTEEEIKAKVKAFFDTLWEANDGTGIDPTTFVNWYIATEILGNQAALTSIFAYKEDADELLKFGPLWGNETALGNSNAAIDMSDLTTEGSYTGMVFNSAVASAWQTKLQSLWQQNWFKQAVKQRWAELYQDGTNDLKATMAARFNAIKTALAGAYEEADANELDEIETYLQQRFDYLDTKFNELTASNILLGDVNGDGDITMADLMTLSAYLLGNNPTPFYPDAADINNDSSITPADLMNLAEILRSK